MSKIILYAILGGLFFVATPVFADTEVPSFSVYLSSTQTVTPAILATVAYDTEDFDVGGYFSTTTYSYSPPPGKYIFNATVRCTNALANASRCVVGIYRNGSQIASNVSLASTGETFIYSSTASKVVNVVSGDVFDVRVINQNDTSISAGLSSTYFSGSQLVSTSSISTIVDNPNLNVFLGLAFFAFWFWFMIWFFKIDRGSNK